MQANTSVREWLDAHTNSFDRGRFHDAVMNHMDASIEVISATAETDEDERIDLYVVIHSDGMTKHAYGEVGCENSVFKIPYIGEYVTLTLSEEDDIHTQGFVTGVWPCYADSQYEDFVSTIAFCDDHFCVQIRLAEGN